MGLDPTSLGIVLQFLLDRHLTHLHPSLFIDWSALFTCSETQLILEARSASYIIAIFLYIIPPRLLKNCKAYPASAAMSSDYKVYPDFLEADTDYTAFNRNPSDPFHDSESETSTLDSSILRHTFENGRRYHSFRDGRYLYPNDRAELGEFLTKAGG